MAIPLKLIVTKRDTSGRVHFHIGFQDDEIIERGEWASVCGGMRFASEAYPFISDGETEFFIKGREQDSDNNMLSVDRETWKRIIKGLIALNQPYSNNTLDEDDVTEDEA